MRSIRGSRSAAALIGRDAARSDFESVLMWHVALHARGQLPADWAGTLFPSRCGFSRRASCMADQKAPDSPAPSAGTMYSASEIHEHIVEAAEEELERP